MKTIPAPTCHHLFPDDHRCGSPSLRNEAFCFFHHPDRQTAPKTAPARLPQRHTSTSKSRECKHLQCPFRRHRWVLAE